MDSTAAIELIKKTLDSKHPYAMFIARVQELLSQNWIVHVKHIYREANTAADCLAATSHSVSFGACFYLFSPSCLGSILRDDLAGMALPRLIV